MLGEPPVLTLRRSFARPDAGQIEAFRDVPSTFVVDALGGHGALDHGIKPLWPEARFAAPVVTARCGPRDNLALYVAIRIARPGDALLLQTGDHTGSAVLGDNVAAIAKRHGITAIVTDGLVRDIEGLLEVGLPIFCRGLTPNSPFKNGPVEVGTRVTAGGQAVDPGDVLIGDRDGVVVVPRARVASVIDALDDVREKERQAAARLAAGGDLPGWVDDLINSERTRELD